MTRRYTVKIEGQKYLTEGSFSYGAFNALKEALEKHFPNLTPIPDGRIVAYAEGYPQWRFEAIDYDRQLGFVVYVTETND